VTRADVLFGNVATLARTTGTVGHRRQEVVMKWIARTKGSKNLSSKCPLYEKFDQRIAGGVPCGM
jgi:hypothetical protein